MDHKLYLIARDFKTLQELARVLVFAHPDRLRVEAVAENVEKDHIDLANSIRKIHGSAIISSLVEVEI